jgi:hypothetical protein
MDNNTIYSSDDDQHADSIYDLSEDTKTINFSFTCPICRYNYNSTNKKIYIISSCGHSFCQVCIDKICICSICRKPVESKNINWAIQSQINGENNDDESINDIEQIYQIFIKHKDEIERLYIKYGDTCDFMSKEQEILINKILVDLKSVKVIETYLLEKLLIPSWLLDVILNKLDNINEYFNTIDNDLVDLLPFCP